MKKSNNYDYDVIIIGAGIGGLVCGCYLAKAGLRTLIVEKNANPGGYCVSFRRKGFNFDACTHTLVSCRKEGSIGKLIDYLNIREELGLVRNNPSDIIITPKFKINIYNEIEKTVAEFQKYFPAEREGIKKFFELTLSSAPQVSLRRMTFEQILNKFFRNKELKKIIAMPTFGTTALPPSRLSSIIGCLIYKEFIFDGGYYTKNGLGNFIEALVKKFIDFGGTMVPNRKIKKILIKNNKANGIVLEDGKQLLAKYVVSACDLRETFFDLIGENNLEDALINKIKGVEYTLSSFIIYLGLNKSLDTNSELKSQLWFSGNDKNIEQLYQDTLHNKESSFLIINSPTFKERDLVKHTKDSLSLSLPMAFVNDNYWTKENNNILYDKLINMAEQVLPDLTKKIELKVIASPRTLNTITLNYRGSSYGCASTLSQFCDPDLSQKTRIENLYLASHWTNLGGGITSVAVAASNASRMIINKEKKL